MAKKEEIELIDAMRKIGLVGLGFAALTKDKVDAIAKELVKRGELDSKEGKKLAQKLLKRSQKERVDLEKKIQTEAKKLLKKSDLATKNDIQRLEKKIDKLKKR